MSILEYVEQHGHEQLSVYSDPVVGLRAFIAIHDTTLGPGLGGVRVWRHPSEEAALMDVLRLSRAMTYKAAAAGLNFGGAKALIWADPKDKSEAMMKSFGRFVASQGGRYIAAEDVGTTASDMVVIRQETPYVVGLPASYGGSGDTLMTGFGVYQGMKACAEEVWGDGALAGRVVVMQGFGKAARALAHYLKIEEAVLIVADIESTALDQARAFGVAQIVSPQDIYGVHGDVFSPCALGGILNRKTIPQLDCKVVCGAANNQLLEDEDAEALQKRGILYAPDYVVNAGGIISVSYEVGGMYNEKAAQERVARIFDTTKRIISTAKQQAITTAKAADNLAEERIAAMRKVRKIYLR